MAKSGGGVKELLINKGEKIGLGIAVVLGGLLLVFGVLGIFNRDDPTAYVNALEQKEKSIRSTINNNQPVSIDPLEGPIASSAVSQPLPTIVTQKPLFDPHTPPDGRRIAPIVARVLEGQADIAILKIPGYDIVIDRDNEGNVLNMKIGVVTAKQAKEKAAGVDNFLNDVKKITKVPRKPRDPNMGFGMGGMFGMGGSPSPPGMGMGGFPPPPGMGMGSGMIGMQGYPAGMFGNMGGMGMGGMGFGQGYPQGMFGMAGASGFSGKGIGEGMGGYAQQAAGTRYEVNYINGADDAEIDKQMEGRRIAVTIHPVRMAVIQAAFPYRLQIERFRTAMRYKTVDELYANPSDLPVFNGVEIQRRGYVLDKTAPDGKRTIEDWLPIDPVKDFANQDLRALSLQDREDPIDLQRVMMPEDYALVMMLPQELVGKYPAMNLQSVKDAIKKLKDAGGKINVPPAQNKFAGAANPFKRNNGQSAGGLINGGENGGGLAGMPKPPKMGMGGGTDMGMGGTPTKIEPPDVAYIRMIDPSIKEGLVYQYRIRVKLLNPNFGKHGLVSKSSDADNKEMPLGDEHWFEIPSLVQVPESGYYYVTEPAVIPAKEREKMAYVPPTPKEGQALVQVHRWYQQLELKGGVKEPVGDWVLAEMLATRGMYVSGQAFTQLPFWSSVDNEFVLRIIPGDKPPPKGKEQRKGVLLEPVRAKSLLVVEIAGGKTRAKIPSNPGEAKLSRNGSLEEDCATEVLFLAPDGRLEVHSSSRDRDDPDRKERESSFKKWVKDTEEKNAKLNSGSSGTNPKEGF